MAEQKNLTQLLEEQKAKREQYEKEAQVEKPRDKASLGVQANYGDEALAAIKKLMNTKITTSAVIDGVRDDQWVSESIFGKKGLVLEDRYDERRFFTNADRKFVDTGIGGHYVCNPKPGFCLYTDAPKPGLLSRNEPTVIAAATNQGMGHYYERAIDTPSRVIHMRFGKPEFNSLIGFFGTHYSAREAIIANTGQAPGLMFWLGKITGAYTGHLLLGGMFFFGILAVAYVGQFAANILKTNPTKFYYSRPCMPLYWATVTNIVNQIMTYKGVFPTYTNDSRMGEEMEFDNQMYQSLSAVMPQVFGEDGLINVYAIVNRAERINIRVRKMIESKLKEGSNYMDLEGTVTMTAAEQQDITKSGNTLTQILGKYFKSTGSAYTDKELAAGSTGPVTLAGGTSSKSEPVKDQTTNLVNSKGQFRAADEKLDNFNKGFFDNFSELLNAEFSDGAAFATFRVDHQGAVSESFSNSTRPSDLGQKINRTTSDARAAYYSFAGGTTGIPGVDEVIKGGQEFLKGALEMVKLDGLLTLAGSAFTDIPDHWENSVANLPTMSYSMRLQAPYGHPVSQLQNIYIPLAMLLAATLPHAAGTRTYTQPFLVELYDPGFATTRTGIVSSLTINRGVSNLGFTKTKDMLACQVDFEIKDLSSIMYMSIGDGIGIDPSKVINAIDSTWTDYLAVLSGAGLAEQIYTGKKLKIRAKNWYRNVQQVATPDYWAGVMRNAPVINLIDLIKPDTGRGDR